MFDNLLSNICKYAMPGTRVYFTSEVQDGRVSISFKNISNYPLDITADELLELMLYWKAMFQAKFFSEI